MFIWVRRPERMENPMRTLLTLPSLLWRLESVKVRVRG
jgi:hypothetical protein